MHLYREDPTMEQGEIHAVTSAVFRCNEPGEIGVHGNPDICHVVDAKQLQSTSAIKIGR